MAYIEGYLDCDDCKTRNGIDLEKWTVCEIITSVLTAISCRWANE